MGRADCGRQIADAAAEATSVGHLQSRTEGHVHRGVHMTGRAAQAPVSWQRMARVGTKATVESAAHQRSTRRVHGVLSTRKQPNYVASMLLCERATTQKCATNTCYRMPTALQYITRERGRGFSPS